MEYVAWFVYFVMCSYSSMICTEQSNDNIKCDFTCWCIHTIHTTHVDGRSNTKTFILHSLPPVPSQCSSFLFHSVIIRRWPIGLWSCHKKYKIKKKFTTPKVSEIIAPKFNKIISMTRGYSEIYSWGYIFVATEWLDAYMQIFVYQLHNHDLESRSWNSHPVHFFISTCILLWFLNI